MTSRRPASATDQDARLDELWQRAMIRDLLLTYCRGVDRKHPELMRSAFSDDALIENGPYTGGPDGFVDWVMENHIHTEQSMHVIANCLIERTGTTAVVESYCLGHQRLSPDAEAARERFRSGDVDDDTKAVRVMAALRWLDRVELRGDQWVIVHRQVVMENMYAHSVDVFEPDTSTLGSKWLIQRRDPFDDPVWSARHNAGLAG